MYWWQSRREVHCACPGRVSLRGKVEKMPMQLIHRRHFPFDHYVLVDEEGKLAPDVLVAEARRQAVHLSAEITGGPENFTLIHNGTGIARREKPHVHIVCTRSRFEKALMYLLIGIKNLCSYV